MRDLLVILVIVSCLNPVTFGQVTVPYDDVGVIYNVNSTMSTEIAAYFQTARNIPDINMIPVNVPDQEHIPMSVFADLRSQVEGHLLGNGLVDSLNYLVTIKGVPFRIGEGPCIAPGTFGQCSSVESELALILGPHSDQIGLANWPANPFHGSTTRHSRAENGIYLVTRLDGYKLDEILASIDGCGPGRPVVKEATTIVMDVSNHPEDQASFWTAAFDNASAPLVNAGWNVLIDTDPETSPADMVGVIGKVSVDHAPAQEAQSVGWAPGSLTFEFTNHSANSFSLNEPDSTHRRVAERVREGVCGALGVVGVVFGSWVSSSAPTLPNYLDTSLHFGLAEAFYSGMHGLSNAQLVIGDPKTSIVLDVATDMFEAGVPMGIMLFPNPTPGPVTIRSASPVQILLYDVSGRALSIPTSSPALEHRLDLTYLSGGVYILHMMDVSGRTQTARLVVGHE